MKKGAFWKKLAGFFADTSPFMTWVGRVALYAVGNLCWLLCSLPLVTLGASTAALCALLLDRENQTFDTAPRAYFRALRRLWRPATALWLPMLALGALLALDWRLLAAQGLTDSPFVLALLLLAGAVYAFTLLWLFPVLSATGRPARAVAKTAFLLGLRELWRSLLLVALEVAGALLLLWCLGASLTLTGLWALFGFAASARVALAVMEPVLQGLREPVE